MTAFWQMPYVPDPEDPEAIEVTGLGDPVRSFISLQNSASAAELAEFRRAWLSMQPDPAEEFRQAMDDLDARITVAVLGTPVTGASAPEAIPPVAAARRRGQCQGCGTDDEVDIWSRCSYCAELEGLRGLNLPGLPLAAWWYLLPGVLGLALGLILVWAVLYVIFYG